MLILDDLQWCDGETLDWLRFLLRFEAQAPLLVVGTVRSEAIDEQTSDPRVDRPLTAQEQVTALELGPLQADETALLAREDRWRCGRRVGQQLHNESEGNPLFVVEAVRAGPLAAAETPRPTTALPSTVQAVIAARLAQLTPLAQQVAQVAATVGRAFTFEILAAVGETPEANLVQSLDELWQRRIVREQEQGYDFCHDKIREVIYSQISRTRRQWLHRRIAEALEARHAPNLEEVYPMLAAHFEMGNEGQRALGDWQQAGEHALATYAPQQALDNFQRALALTNAMSAAVSQQADARFGLARGYFALDQHDEATAQGKQALTLRQLDEPQRCKLLYFMAEVAFAGYDVAGCESYAQAAREAAEE